MLEHCLFGSTQAWRKRKRLRPMLLAVFSYRHDAGLVPQLLQNIEPMVDGWVAFDDRQARDLFSNEPQRRRLLIERAIELGATWVLAVDPDERIERGGATRIRSLIQERRRIVWEFNLREMFTASSYRVDGIWGSKLQGRLFPVFDGALCSDKPLHGAWCVAPSGYSILPAGLNLYHLKMMSSGQRLARRNLYKSLDPDNLYQSTGYDYLLDETEAVFESIPPNRDFFPAHPGASDADPLAAPAIGLQAPAAAAVETYKPTASEHLARERLATQTSQLGEMRISVGPMACLDSKLAVVVIGLRAPKSLFDAVTSLILQDTPAEIVVVNSGGGDVSEVLGQHFPYVVLVELNPPLFVGAARNVGIQLSSAPFVAFLAGDCVAAPGWVAERIQAHMEGEGAVANVVENDKPGNPFAWASHLMTYGHRMAGAASEESAPYGASYDRMLFDKYGFFSEAMVIGEDSEFNSRFRSSDPIELYDSIRTVHRSPGDPISFLIEQFRRGLRGRYLADFFGEEVTVAYMATATVRRIVRPAYLSMARLRGKRRFLAIISLPLVPFGAICFLAGMVVSYAKARAAERLFVRGLEMDLSARPALAVGLLRQAIELRPATARYHHALGELLKQIGQYDSGVRELYSSWDIDRRNLVDLYGTNNRPGSGGDNAERSEGALDIQLVVLADGSDTDLAEFLRAISGQKSQPNESRVIVVAADDRRRRSKRTREIELSYADIATFVSPRELPELFGTGPAHRDESARSFIVVSSSLCVPPPDWLAMLWAYIRTYPEVELFHGMCRPVTGASPNFVERLSYDLGFFPRAPGNGGLLRFGHAVGWACESASLIAGGGLAQGGMDMPDIQTLTERVLSAGASSLNATDWQTSFRIDLTLRELLRRLFHEGYQDARHRAAADGRDLAPSLVPEGSLGETMGAAWRFMVDHLRIWRFERRSFLSCASACLILLPIGFARQLGRRSGLKRPGAMA